MKLTKSDLRKILTFSSTLENEEVRQKAIDALQALNENILNVECNDYIYMVECKYKSWDDCEVETYYQGLFYSYNNARKMFDQQIERAKEDYDGQDVEIDMDKDYFEIREEYSGDRESIICLKKIQIN